MYHRFDETKYPSTNINMKDFKEHMNIILKKNYSFYNPNDFNFDFFKPKPNKKFLLTVDDAFTSFYENAWPYLKQKKIPFILFVSTQSVGKKGVLELLTKGRLDKSGDFTKGANLKKEDAQEILALLSANSIVRDKDNNQFRLSSNDTLYKIENENYFEGLKEVDKILNYLNQNEDVNIMSTDLSFEENKINLQMDLSVVRGLEYYTGTVMEAETTSTSFWKSSADISAYKNIKLGSISGGGRYDKLVSRFLKDDYPAVGISIGLDRLLFLVKEKYKDQTTENPIIICVFNQDYFSKY